MTSLGIVVVISVIFLFANILKKDDSFDIDKKSHYTLKYNTEFDKKNVYGIKDPINFSAMLDFRVFKKDENFIYAGFELSDVKIGMQNSYLEKRIASLYELFFLVKMDKNGKFLEYYFPRRDDDVKGLFMLFSMLQTVELDKTSYKVEEFDYNGVYEAEYSRMENKLSKSRIKYIEKKSDAINIVFGKSNINIVLDDENNYIQSLNGYETIVSKENGIVVLENSNTVLMEKVNTPVNNSLKIWQEEREVSEIIDSFQQEAEKYEPFWVAEEKASKINYIKTNHLNFSNFLKKVQENMNIQNLQELQNYLSLYPKEIEKLYAIIIDSDDKSSMKLIHMLEKLGNEEAQKLLLKLIESDNSTLSQDNHLRAIIAIGAIKNVSEENIDALWKYSQNVDTSDLLEQSKTIVLALGSIASNSEENIASKINQRLKDNLLTGNYATKKISLLSMQNSGIDNFQAEVLEVVKTSSSIKLQVSAIKILQDARTGEVEKVLYEKMKRAQNDYVKAAAIESLSFFEPKDEIVEEIQKNIATQESSHTKTEMVKYLAKTIDKYPQNSKYLEDALQGEENREVVKLIIKTIRKK